MNKSSAILVTAVGALIGQGIARALRKDVPECRVIGMDRGSNIYGASLCDKWHQKPCREDSPEYLPWLRRVIEDENISLILPGIEDDVYYFHDNRRILESWPARIALNNPSCIEAGKDKWTQHETLAKAGVMTIPSSLVTDWERLNESLGEPPYVIKPRRGSGSRGIAVISQKGDLDDHLRHGGADFIMQKRVGNDDEEYSVGFFGYGDGTGSDLIVLKRRLWNGMTWLAESVAAQDGLASTCAAITKAFRPLGPTNYQFRRDRENWFLLEMNPRFSSSTAMRAGFGFNEPLMCVQHYLSGVSRPCPGPIKHGVCQRMIMEHFVLS